MLFGGNANGVIVNPEGLFSITSTVAIDMPAGFHPLDIIGNLGSLVEIEYEVLVLG